jgi:cytochrome c oxidase assembly protein subunit 15
MVLSGGLVAGIRAGLAYNTFPLMDGHVVPPEIFLIDPWYLNFFRMATVQFVPVACLAVAFSVPFFGGCAGERLCRLPRAPQLICCCLRSPCRLL